MKTILRKLSQLLATMPRRHLKDTEKARANKVLITLNRSDEFKNVYDRIICLNKKSASASFIQTGVKNYYTIYGLTHFLDLVLSMYYEKYYSQR